VHPCRSQLLPAVEVPFFPFEVRPLCHFWVVAGLLHFSFPDVRLTGSGLSLFSPESFDSGEGTGSFFLFPLFFCLPQG